MIDGTYVTIDDEDVARQEKRGTVEETRKGE
jgi:hypothetical protein